MTTLKKPLESGTRPNGYKRENGARAYTAAAFTVDGSPRVFNASRTELLAQIGLLLDRIDAVEVPAVRGISSRKWKGLDES